ncbi:MAG: dTMP kinase [Patescibacteria group bacterium]|nr:dTMP kinase [Patescibacteria group bacterium]
MNDLLYTHSYPGLYIVLEGIDFCGTTTQSKLLAETLESEGYFVLPVHEPDDRPENPVGYEIRQILLGKVQHPGAEKLQKMFVEARRFFLQRVVTPALERCKIVISDRNLESTKAYGKATGIPFEKVISWHEGGDFYYPDVTYLLDCSVKVAEERRLASGQAREYFEGKRELQQRVREAYLEIAMPGRVYSTPNIWVVDGEMPINVVFGRLIKCVREEVEKKENALIRA